MPILLKVDELEAGMCLARNVVNRYSVLLPAGHTLSNDDIASLARRIPDSLIDVIDPLLDQIVQFEDDSQDKKVSHKVRKNISSVVQKVSSKIREGVILNAENISGMEEVVRKMLEYLKQNPVTMALIEQSCGWDDYLQEHSANVFYLSLVIGNSIRNYISRERYRLSAATSISKVMELTPLATAALFHDLGMVPIDYLYYKKEPLTADEKEQIRAHPIKGAEMLPAEINPMVRLVIRSHHENYNGSGYPQGLPGHETNIFARIIRIADAYSAAIADKIYESAKHPTIALYEMLYGRYRQFYDPILLKVLASIIQPFPIGGKLKLEDGRWAVVVRHNRQDSFKPEIIIAFDELGDPLNAEDLEKPFCLGERADIKIHSFAGQDLRFLNESNENMGRLNQNEVKQLLYSELFDYSYP